MASLTLGRGGWALRTPGWISGARSPAVSCGSAREEWWLLSSRFPNCPYGFWENRQNAHIQDSSTLCYFDCKYGRIEEKTIMKTKLHLSFHPSCRDTASLRLPVPACSSSPWFGNLGYELMYIHGASLPSITKKPQKLSGKNCSKTKVSKTPNTMVWKNYQVCPSSCFCFIFRIFQVVPCRKD